MRLLKLFSTTAVLIMLPIAMAACTGSGDTVTPESSFNPDNGFTLPSEFESGRKLLGLWYINLETGELETARARSLMERINIADALLMEDYAGALGVNVELFSNYGAFAPPAIKLTVNLQNIFQVTGWNVRGILLDNSGSLEMSYPDGFTHLWDDGGDVPINPFWNFDSSPGGSFPPESDITREFIFESPTGVIPPGIYFAADVGIDGPLQAATEFPVSNVNGVFRWEADSVDVYGRIKDDGNFTEWVAALSWKYSGTPTFMAYQDDNAGYGQYHGLLSYTGNLEVGVHPLYFVAWSDQDVPVLGAAKVRIDPGPFATGPASSGCSQRSYDPARTCRSIYPVSQPQHEFELRVPPSRSGIVLSSDVKLIRMLEQDQSIAYQWPGSQTPEWTRLAQYSSTITTPAVGNDGTIFYLEPHKGRLRAMFPDGSDRWIYEYGKETHGDLLLTSSPFGGLLVTILRENGADIQLVAVGTDGHHVSTFNLPPDLTGSANSHRLASGPNGTLYYTMPTGGIFALNLGLEPLWAVAKPEWNNTIEPVVGDDDRIFAIQDGGSIVTAHTLDGVELWSTSLPDGRKAKYPSLDYAGNLFVTVDENGDNDWVYKFNGVTGFVELEMFDDGIRGYVAHDSNGDFLYVYRGAVDDFFTSRNPEGVTQWTLFAPGVSENGAYPVVDFANNIYVQGPDGMYVVMYY